ARVPLLGATHPVLRGRGIFRGLEEASWRRAAERFGLALTCPNEASRRVFVSQFGWTDLRRPRIWTRPARGPSRLLRGVEQVDGFGRRADELWRALASSYDTGLVRDGAYLDWRFASSPRG